MLCAIARLLESIQDLNFRLGIQTKVLEGLEMCDFAQVYLQTLKIVNYQIDFLCYAP